MAFREQLKLTAWLLTAGVIEQTIQKGLVRGIGRWDLLALTINVMVGAGIFGLPSKIYGLTRAWSVLAYLVCAVLVTLIILCFAEVGSRFVETGGPYLYSRGLRFCYLCGCFQTVRRKTRAQQVWQRR